LLYAGSGGMARKSVFSSSPGSVGQVPGRRVPLRGPLGHGPQADALQLLRDAAVQLPGRAGLGAGDLLQQLPPRKWVGTGPCSTPGELKARSANEGTFPRWRFGLVSSS